MKVFVDTSGLFATLDAGDDRHDAARAVWREILSAPRTLWTTSYVLVESYALVQRRLGLDALEVLTTDVAPVFHVHWVGHEDHARAVAGLLAARRRELSLVDCVSFEVMRRRGIERCFAFDSHFREQGFEVLP